MFDFSINSHKPLREIVFEELRYLILTGKMDPGKRLMEIELAEQMGVSRTPIREAIRKLEEEGLVIIEPRRGAYVSEISIPDIVNILEVRETMDGLAAFYAAQRMTEQQKKDLQRASEAFNKAVTTGDMEEMIEKDSDFHKIIVDGSNNSYLAGMVARLQELVLRFRYIYYKDFKRAEDMPNEHLEIVTAIFNGNAEKARDEAEKHINKLQELVLSESIVNAND